MSGMQRLRLGFLLIGLIWGAQARSYVQAQNDELRTVTEEWAKKRAFVKNARYEITGEIVVPKGRFNVELSGAEKKDYPDADFRFTRTVSLMLDFENNRFKRSIREQVFHADELAFAPSYRVNSFDGRTFKAFVPREKNRNPESKPSVSADVILGSEDLAKYRAPFFAYDEYPIFFSCGIFTTNPRPGQLRESMGEKDFRVKGHAVKGGQDCLVLASHTNKFGEWEEIWVDLGKTGAISRWISHQPDYVATYMNIEYVQGKEGWVLSEWSLTQYWQKFKVDRFCHYRVDKSEINGSIDTREYELENEKKPGMIVKDQTHDQFFQVEADGGLSPISFGANGEIMKKSPWRKFIAWGGGGLGLVLVILLLYRFRSRVRGQYGK
jgi:hypothetical protein